MEDEIHRIGYDVRNWREGAFTGQVEIFTRPLAFADRVTLQEFIDETKMVLERVNARRVVVTEFEMNNFETEPLDGFVVRLEGGKLGLRLQA